MLRVESGGCCCEGIKDAVTTASSAERLLLITSPRGRAFPHRHRCCGRWLGTGPGLVVASPFTQDRTRDAGPGTRRAGREARTSRGAIHTRGFTQAQSTVSVKRASHAVRGPGKAAGSSPSRDRARVRGPIARDLWGAQPSATRSSPGPCPEGRATASSRREPPAVAGTWPVRTRAWRSCCTDGDFTILSLAGARRPVSFGFYGVGSVVCEHGTLHALARIEVHLGSAMVVPRPWTGRRRCS